MASYITIREREQLLLGDVRSARYTRRRHKEQDNAHRKQPHKDLGGNTQYNLSRKALVVTGRPHARCTNDGRGVGSPALVLG